MSVPRAIEEVSAPLCDLALCHARLMLDARWPWIVLVPKVQGLIEIEELSAADRARLMEETVIAGRAVRAIGKATGFEIAKLNVGALGNVTPDLHVHVVGRQPGDPAWPGPVWGVGAAVAYDQAVLAKAEAAAVAALTSS